MRITMCNLSETMQARKNWNKTVKVSKKRATYLECYIQRNYSLKMRKTKTFPDK